MAETLISLVIIGIVAAMVLPALVATKPSENKLLYKKTFFTVSEAVMAVINNSELYDISYDDVLAHPLSSSENFCQYLANYLNTVGTIDCGGKTGSFMLANGVRINNIPIKFSTTCTSEAEPYTNICTLYVSTKGEIINGVGDDNRDCKKTTKFKINIIPNGKVFTVETWPCENSILKTGSKVQQDKDSD